MVETVDVQRQMMNGARTCGQLSLATAILLLFLVYFLLAQGEMFKEKLVKLSGERLSQKKVTVQMIDEIIAQIGRFVFYQFWSGLLVGVMHLAVLHVDRRALRRFVGRCGRRAELHSVFGPTIIMVRVRRRRGAAVQVGVDGGARRGDVCGVTALEGFLLAPVALGRAASVNSVVGVRGRDVRRLDVGADRPDPRRAGADDHQDRCGSRRVAVEPEPAPRRPLRAHPLQSLLRGMQMEYTYTLPSAQELASRLPAGKCRQY